MEANVRPVVATSTIVRLPAGSAGASNELVIAKENAATYGGHSRTIPRRRGQTCPRQKRTGDEDERRAGPCSGLSVIATRLGRHGLFDLLGETVDSVPQCRTRLVGRCHPR